MDFKIGDDFTEEGPVKHEMLNTKQKIFIVVGVSMFILIVIICIFLILNSSTKKVEEVPKVTKTTLNLTDKEVLTSYKMVTYGYNGGRSDKFLLGVGLDIDSFNNQEKYYYALQYCVFKDLTETSEVNSNGLKIYTLPKSYMDVYMQRVFGEKIEYDTSSVITNTFKFKINNLNTATLTYDENKDNFKVDFISLNEEEEAQDNTFYKLDKAYSYSDGKLILEEKVIYTKLEDNNGKQSLLLFSDKNNSNTLGTITELKEGNILQEYTNTDPEYYANLPLVFNFDDYKDNAGTIIYTFKSDKYGYYFVKSEVK